MAKIVVTGASGKAGRAVVRALLESDYDVLAVDVTPPAESAAPSLLADLTEFGQTVECLAGAESVVHLAAIPASGIHTEETTFRTNMLSTYNVFEAARLLGLRRVVWASSETILGLRHRHDPTEPRVDGRGVPNGALHADRGRLRHAPLDPEGTELARVRAAVVLARSHRGRLAEAVQLRKIFRRRFPVRRFDVRT